MIKSCGAASGEGIMEEPIRSDEGLTREWSAL